MTSTMDKDTMALRNAKGLLKDLEAKIKGIKESNEKVNSQFGQSRKEKGDIEYKFENACKALQSKSNYKNDILEQKLLVF